MNMSLRVKVSIETALEVLDAFRRREAVLPPDGLRLVATDTVLLVAAHNAEQLLALESDGPGVER